MPDRARAVTDRVLACHCSHLTVREVDILTLSAAGLRAREIASVLCISARTVEYHMSAMMRRTDTATVAQLVAICYVAGVLAPGEWPPTWSGSLCMRSVLEAGLHSQRRAQPSNASGGGQAQTGLGSP